MRQRAMAALALAGSPRLLIADEPTTALDTTIQAQILDLLKSLTRELDLAVLLITHDLGVVREIATRALVMYAGRIVEDAPVAGLLASPAHPYSKALLECLPLLASGAPRTSRLPVLPGSVPAPGEWPPGCAFAPRCKLAIDQCRSKTPAPDQFSLPSRRAACFRSSEITA
jgi:oligopeptide/dipeptide ABC transporter ATP-binding protein